MHAVLPKTANDPISLLVEVHRRLLEVIKLLLVLYKVGILKVAAACVLISAKRHGLRCKEGTNTSGMIKKVYTTNLLMHMRKQSIACVGLRYGCKEL